MTEHGHTTRQYLSKTGFLFFLNFSDFYRKNRSTKNRSEINPLKGVQNRLSISNFPRKISKKSVKSFA